MSDFNLPTLSSAYTDFLSQLKSRDVDAITLCLSVPSNIPTGAIRYLRASNKFQEWDGVAWVDKILALAGGGTGGSSAASARSSLGLGTLAVQNDSAVSISGGTITGVNLDASGITAGTLALARGGTSASLAIGASGTFLRSNGSVVSFGVDGSALTNLNATALASGTVSTARLPANIGYVSTIKHQITAVSFAISSSYADSGLTLTIVPSSAASRIRVECAINMFVNTQYTGGATVDGHIDALLLRNGATVREWRFALGISGTLALGALGASQANVALDVVDSPASTASLIYKIQLRSASVNGGLLSAGMNVVNGTSGSSITVSEIGA